MDHGEDAMSMRVRECVVSVATAHKEMGQPAGRVDFDFEVMPFSIGIKISRPVSNSVLMTKFQSIGALGSHDLGQAQREEDN